MKNGANHTTPTQQVADVLEDTRQVTQRLAVAVREALLDHKRAGNPVAIWRDGKVVIVPPDEIIIEGAGHTKNGANGHGNKP